MMTTVLPVLVVEDEVLFVLVVEDEVLPVLLLIGKVVVTCSCIDLDV